MDFFTFHINAKGIQLWEQYKVYNIDRRMGSADDYASTIEEYLPKPIFPTRHLTELLYILY